VAGTNGRVHLPRRHQFQKSAAGEPPSRGRNQVGAEPMCLYWARSTLCHLYVYNLIRLPRAFLAASLLSQSSELC
jgi:hypothetical protein